MIASNEREQVISEQTELMITCYVGIASFTILVWDHLISLEDEIKYIWKKKKGTLIWLFFINRYLTPLSFIVNLIAYFSYAFDTNFVRYEGSMTVIGINTTALMMLLRIYAMYDNQPFVVTAVATVFAIELGTNAWLLTNGMPVEHSPLFHGKACTMIFNPDQVKGWLAAASAWLPLLYDTIVLVLTVRRTFSEVKHPSVSRTMRILLKEGILYYSVIFSITLMLTLMIVFAPDGLKNATAQLTVAMMSRITLHLKKEAHRVHDPLGSNSAFDLSTSMIRSRVYSPISFAHRGRSRPPTSPVAITVQEWSTSYDDGGREVPVPVPKKSHCKPHVTQESWQAQEEWYEFSNVGTHRETEQDIRTVA
ncbi:hypothetical protein C8Q80DRAFT_1117449 [Daedaleopsis nitida]|nr:hypothetical protein C8Q80DRAFT_1117449 [Daedaleopsis nitida]